MNPYNYSAVKPCLNLHLRETTKNWLRYAVDFPSAFNDGRWGSNTVRGEYFQPRQENGVQLAILLHGLGDHGIITCKLLAKALAKNHIACLILYSVVHSSRMPEIISQQFPLLTPEEWFQIYQTSVIEVRQVIDWASSREEIDREKIAVVGISFGGFISAITMGIDERIGAGVFIVAGGNNEKLNHMSSLISITGDYRRTETEYQCIQQSYLQYLTEVAEKGFENVNPPRKSFLTDPMTLAYRLRQRPVLMINARWDEAISKEATFDFWRESGKPDIIWLPATHATIWLWYLYISRKIAGFLSSTFGVDRSTGDTLGIG